LAHPVYSVTVTFDALYFDTHVAIFCSFSLGLDFRFIFNLFVFTRTV